MKIQYSVSLWNFTHYAHAPNLERVIAGVREQGYGIELWGRSFDENDLYDKAGRKRLKPIVKGMVVSLHTHGARTMDRHKYQIDAAEDFGARVIVLHTPDVTAPGGELDIDLAGRAVEYARKAGVKLVLENGQLDFLKRAAEEVKGLGLCLDTGHTYNQGQTMADAVAAVKTHLAHVHVQDICSPAEATLPQMAKDHYLPGTGGIPMKDWKLLGRTMRVICLGNL